MSEELKPCPFCGGRAAIDVGRDEEFFLAHVFCTNYEVKDGYCQCEMKYWAESAEKAGFDAVKAWNTRADDPECVDALNRAAGKWAHADYENRELRETIQVLYALIKRQCAQYEDDDHCRACDLWPMMSERCDLKFVEDRMEKLGIEVKI